MLELRPTCENCDTLLPPNSNEAYICSYECTFCKKCVAEILHNVCPNCGGGFQKRPVRPKKELINNPSSKKIIHKPIDPTAFKEVLLAYKDTSPNER